jgi:hypothetical protein
MEVRPEKAPKNSLPIQSWEWRSHLGLFGTVIQEIEEKVCPQWMLEDEPGDDSKFDIALKWNSIAWIIEEAGDSLVTQPGVRAKYIKEAAKIAGVKEPRIRALLTRYFYYGGHPDALMAMHKFKGAPGVSRFAITKKKMGRPNDNVQLDTNTRFTGRNMTRYYLRHWKVVLEQQYASGKLNVSEAYEVLVRCLRGFNRNAAGEITSYPVRPEKLPERALFLRYGAKIIRQLQMKRAALGELEWKNSFAAQRGHSEDLANGVVDIYDFDGMEFNIEIRYGGEIVGKPNVLLAVDRRSRATVGWFVWLGRENGYAYKHCLFNAFTSKVERLAQYGLSHLNGFVHGVCEHAFFDRGPGISLKVTEAVTKRIRVDGLMAKPRDAPGKGVVENVNGRFQRELSNLPGAFRRNDNIRDKDRHDDSEKNAVVEFNTFMRLLLCAINDYNLYTPVSHLLTHEMMTARHRVKPNPLAIFVWNRNMRRGDAAYDWPAAALYKNLLESYGRLVANGEVRFKNAVYSSDELRLYYEQVNAGPNDRRISPMVTIYVFAETDYAIAWEKPDGSLGILEMMKRGEKKYKGGPSWLHTFIDRLNNADKRRQRVDEARNAMLPAEKERVLQDVDGLPKTRAGKRRKRENRADANAEITSENLDSGLEILGLRSNAPSVVQPTTSSWLVGYRKAHPNEASEDDNW